MLIHGRRVVHALHGRSIGDTVILSGATAVGGITPNGTFTVATVPSVNAYTFTFTSNATSLPRPFESFFRISADRRSFHSG